MEVVKEEKIYLLLKQVKGFLTRSFLWEALRNEGKNVGITFMVDVIMDFIRQFL